MTKEKLIVIIGPTGVGKTKLSLELAKKWKGEVINGDSMQVYKNLDIGTAKVTAEEQGDIPHHLFDILEVDEEYSVSDFQKQASKKIQEIADRHNVPILVGGSGLYVESLLFDVSHGQSEPNWDLRFDLEDYADQKGNEALWALLQEKDPKAAETIHFNNVRRVIRALEVIHETGQSFSSFQKEKENKEPRYDSFVIGLNTDRQVLYQRINDRVIDMVDAGLEEEARKLYERVDIDGQAARGIGYKEWWPYFEGQQDLDDVIENIQKNSRHYAKRQLTWFRNRTPVDLWLDLIAQPESLDDLDQRLTDFLEEVR